MGMTKHGFIFTLIAIFLIAIFVFVLYASTSRIFVEKQALEAERTEALVVNLFTEQLTDRYLDAFVALTSKSALNAMIAYVEKAQVSEGIPDPEAFYRNMIMNGTVPYGYDETYLRRSFAMTLVARNGSEEIIVAAVESRGDSTSFGNTLTTVQRVSATETYPELQHVSHITIEITNVSATSGDLYVVVYNETLDVVSLDYQQFTEDGEYTFIFGGHLPLTEETYYDIMLAAPFTETTSDYNVAISSSSNEFSCLDFACIISFRDFSGTTDTMLLPIDFVLGKIVVGEGFLRNAVGMFEQFGREEMNIDTTMTVTDIMIDEKDAWTIGVNVSVLINTSRETVSFIDVESFGTADVTIIGLRDPYNMLQDWDMEFVIVPQNVSADFVVEDVYKHLSEQTFVFNEEAPSFLERFKGSDASASSCCGIQTMLTTDDLAGYEDEGYSYVDYKFMDATECSTDTANPHYLYIISSDPGQPESWDSSLYGSLGPYYEWEDIEYYHMDEMDLDGSITITQATCPNE
jgi:hypothetical protein